VAISSARKSFIGPINATRGTAPLSLHTGISKHQSATKVGSNMSFGSKVRPKVVFHLNLPH
jgi:hypothetical protein